MFLLKWNLVFGGLWRAEGGVGNGHGGLKLWLMPPQFLGFVHFCLGLESHHSSPSWSLLAVGRALKQAVEFQVKQGSCTIFLP